MDEVEYSYRVDLANIDDRIRTCKMQLDYLKSQRYKILAKLQSLDMGAVFERIAEKGLSPSDVLELIDNAENPA